MAENHCKLPSLVVLAALLACGTPSPERLLDDACLDQQCATSGSARETSGLTADSIGFELGPGPGSVNIMVPALPGSLGTGVELLLRGSGSVSVTIEKPDCAPDCSSGAFELTKQWRWVPVGSAASSLFELQSNRLYDRRRNARRDFDRCFARRAPAVGIVASAGPVR